MTALTLSVVAHLALGVVLIGGGGWGKAPEVFSAALPPPQAEHEPIMAGIERSQSVTINWLGFEDPTEHRADPSVVDQAAFSPDPVGDPTLAEPNPTQEAQAEPQPTPEQPAETQPTATEVATAEAPKAATLATPADVDAPAPPLLALRTASPDLPASPLIKIVTRAPPSPTAHEGEPAEAREAQPKEPAETPAKPAQEAGQPAQQSTTPGQPHEAIESDKESSATSKEQTLDWHPGRPPAAEGLDISTVNPKFAITTRLAALPRNPMVRIEFRKSGRVAKAEFLPGQATGYGDVDGPLLDALYRWTAKGKALDALETDDPDTVVAFRMRIILIPSAGPVRKGSSDR